jgi:hypothetical protein
MTAMLQFGLLSFLLTKRKEKSKETVVCGISESDVKNQADVRDVGASEVFKNGYKV